MVTKLKPVAVLFHDGSILERERLGVFKVKVDSKVVGGLTIAPEGITISVTNPDVLYKSRDEQNGIFTDSVDKIVLDLETLKVKELQRPKTSYTAHLDGKKEVLVEDRLIANGKEYFHSFVFQLDEGVKMAKDLLKISIIKEDWEKIKAMKQLK
jgi:hypothetical protein